MRARPMTMISHTPNSASTEDIRRVIREVGAGGHYFTATAVLMRLEELAIESPRFATVERADVESIMEEMTSAAELTWHPGDTAERNWYVLKRPVAKLTHVVAAIRECFRKTDDEPGAVWLTFAE